MQLGKPVQVIDGRFRGRNDIDAAEEKHQGKNSESDNDFVLHRLIDRSLSGSRRRR